MWRRIDLHIHTPASVDYQQTGVGILDILHRAEERGLDAIALTDHNSVRGYADLWREIEDLELLEYLGRLQPNEAERLAEFRRLLARILVLPGFEFTAQFGFHILAIFPEGTTVRLMEHLLLLLGVPEDRFGSGEVGATTDVLRAYEILDEHGALVIGAHVNSTHGIAMQGLRFGGQTKIAYTQDPHLHALEVTDLLPATNRRSTARFFSGTKSEYPRRMHCIQGSDAHRLEQDPARETNLGIGDRPTEVLLPETSFAALKALLTSDEFDRVRAFTAPPSDPVKAARLEGNTALPGLPRERGLEARSERHPARRRRLRQFGRRPGLSRRFGIGEAIDRRSGRRQDGRSRAEPRHRRPDHPAGRGDVRGAGLRRQTGRRPARGRGGAQAACRRPRRHLRPPRRGVCPGDARRDRADGHRRRGYGAGGGHRDAGRRRRPLRRTAALVGEPATKAGAAPERKARPETRGRARPAVPAETDRRTEGQADLNGSAAPEPESPAAAPAADLPEIYEETVGADPVAPTTGIEVLDSYEQDGIRFYTLRDLRYHKLIHNVTKSTDRRLWRAAIAQREKGDLDETAVRWKGDYGLWRSYRQRSGDRRYDLVYRGDGDPRIFFGVSESGMDDRWKALLPPAKVTA